MPIIPYMETLLFWDNVNALIKRQNKTQTSVSIDCGLNPRRIQNLSGASRAPDAIEAYKIAQALNTTVEYLVTGVESDTAKRELEELKRHLVELGQG